MVETELKKHDNPEDLKKTKAICAKHSVSTKQLVNYEVILGMTLKDLKHVFEEEFGTKVQFQCIYIVLSFKGQAHKMYIDNDNQTLLEYDFAQQEFSLDPGKEFYILCEDKFVYDTHLKGEDA